MDFFKELLCHGFGGRKNGVHGVTALSVSKKVADVKKLIEASKGSDVYPAPQQMLIHQGKVLKDDTTLGENKVAEKSFVVIILTKAPQPSAHTGAPTATLTASPAPAAASTLPAFVTTPAPIASATTDSQAGSYGQAASDLVAGPNLEGKIQQILDMGGGTWEDTVVHALRAAARPIDYLYSGIPEQPEAVGGQVANSPAQPPQSAQPASGPPSRPNANPLNPFPQGLLNVGAGAGAAGNLDFLRDNQQFEALRSMVQANPQILQPMLQELGKQNPNLVRLIGEHQADFLRLINEPAEGGEVNVLGDAAVPQAIAITPEDREAIERIRNLLNQPAKGGEVNVLGDAAVPQAIAITPEEREAVESLEAMGFARAIVLQVFVACDKNEELSANYLFDHMHEFED